MEYLLKEYDLDYLTEEVCEVLNMAGYKTTRCKDSKIKHTVTTEAPKEVLRCAISQKVMVILPVSFKDNMRICGRVKYTEGGAVFSMDRLNVA